MAHFPSHHYHYAGWVVWLVFFLRNPSWEFGGFGGRSKDRMEVCRRIYIILYVYLISTSDCTMYIHVYITYIYIYIMYTLYKYVYLVYSVNYIRLCLQSFRDHFFSRRRVEGTSRHLQPMKLDSSRPLGGSSQVSWAVSYPHLQAI